MLDAGEVDHALDETTRIGAVAPSAPLAPDERHIAGLVADGLGDREIAETLWITQRAVEQHLSSSPGRF